jgi:uncharacterized membrane protein
MDQVLRVVLAFGLFAATHIGLAAPRLRRALVARLGRWGFTWLFTAVASVTFALAVSSYALHAAEGPAGPALGRYAPARLALLAAIAVGSMLMAGSFAGYARSPYGPRGEDSGEPHGLARVTRHPFFVGVVLLGGAHALLATRLVGAVAMGSLALFAGAGAWFQDRKLLALRGQRHADYLAATSSIPFVAILSGRQRLVLGELPHGGFLLGLGLAWALRAVHAHLFDHGGAYVIAAVVGGALAILASEGRRERRARRLASHRAPA